MSNPVVILKNTTGANLKYKGIVIKYTLDRDHFRQVDRLCDHPGLNADIDSGDIVVNDGTNDLSAADGKLHLCSALYSTIPNVSSTPFAAGQGGFVDVWEFGESGSPVDKFIKSSYNNHTSVDSSAIALANGRVVHVTLSTEMTPEDNWFGQIVVGATKDGAVTGVCEDVKGATKSDIGGTFTIGKEDGKFDPVDLTDDAVFDDVPTIAAFVANDRILIKNQTDATQNGIYEVKTAGASGKLERASDFDSDSEFVTDIAVSVTTGTTLGGTSWKLDLGGTLNTDDVDWSSYTGDPLFSGGTQIGTDLEKTAGVLDKVFTDLTGFEFSAGDRISFYIKQGQIGAGAAEEPVVRLFVQYD